MPATDANYQIAWDLLCDRILIRRAIDNSCLRMHVSQKPPSTPNSYKIRELIETTKQTIQCIETISVDVDNWGPLLAYIIQTKMDPYTFKAWEVELKGTHESPTYEKLCEFLEARYRACDSTAIPSTSFQNHTDSIKSYQSANELRRFNRIFW